MCECKVCKQPKVRVRGGKRGTGAGYYQLDGAGRRWNGLVCPDCRAHSFSTKTDLVDADVGSADVLNPPKLRACRQCKTLSPNYYMCPPCTSNEAQFGCYDEDMYTIDTGTRRRSGLLAGFHY